MSKPLLFYTIDEFTDADRYCKRKGLTPFKFEYRELDGHTFKSVIQYTKDGFIYDVLEADQCYSGYTITLMRSPKLSYENLLHIALTSRHLAERAGAIGIILKDYPLQFQDFLHAIGQKDSTVLYKNKHIERMIAFIHNDIRMHTSYVCHLKKILSFCENFFHKKFQR